MDKPIPEAVLDRLAHEVYQVHCDTPIRAFPNDSHWPKWRAVVQHVADHFTAAQQQGQAVAIDWTFQHDETGRISFCPNDGVNTPENFAANNPRYTLCGPAYSAPQPMQQGGGDVVAWCALTPNGQIAYFDGKPMIMPGPTGNEHHPTPLYTAPPSAPVGVEAAKHWHDLYRKECQLRQDDAARYGQQIVDLEALAPQPAAVDGAIRQAAQELVAAVRAIPEAKLLALDADPHPPSALSVLADDLAEALATQHQEPTT